MGALRVIGSLVIGVVILVAAAAAGLTGWMTWRFHASKPQLEGAVSVAQAPGAAAIARDGFGIPHIFGENAPAVFFALGYAHAQDRMFQMDGLRRSIQGRLSELVGARTVEVDARARLLGYHRIARQGLEAVAPETRAVLEAYTAGVNALITDPSYAPAPEHALLFAEVEPWTAEDTAAVWVYMANTLTSGLAQDRDAVAVDGVLTREQQAEFFQPYPTDFAPTTIASEDWPAAANATASDAPPLGVTTEEAPQPGSNAWAVSGTRTASGRAMLANDPHLGLAAPGTWYLTRLSLPTGDVVGATLPGAPFVIIGRNAHAAWGFTNTEIDGADIVERAPTAASPLPEEAIAVRFGATVRVTPEATADGAVLKPPFFAAAQSPERVRVLRTVVDDPNNALADVIYALNQGVRWRDLEGLLPRWVAPSQNLTYAERGANGEDDLIAFRVLGRVRVAPASAPWTLLAPYDNPGVVNPRDGLIVNANNQVTPADAPLTPPGRYAALRALRIDERLRETRLHDLDRFTDIQTDVTSAEAQRLKVALSRARPRTAAGGLLMAMLEDWDGRMGADRHEPLIFSYWMRAAAPRLWGDELGPTFDRFNRARRVFVDRVLNGALSHWCDDVTTDLRDGCADILGQALDDAAARLAADLEVDPADPERLLTVLLDEENPVTWGAAHQAVFRHPLLDPLPVLGPMFRVSVPVGGDGGTINVAAYRFRNGDFEASHGPGLRSVHDLADLDASRFMIAPGQSAHPLSPHYRDLAPLWAAGEYVEIRADWPGAPRGPDEPLGEWVAEYAPPSTRLLTLAPSE